VSSPKTFPKSFLQQEPLPDAAIEAAVAVMASGRLHRYDATADDPGETALLELEFARYQGSRYALACASCGYALYVAMLSAGVGAGDAVLVNGFTLAPVPGAVANCGARPVFVDTTDDLTVDLDDLERKAAAAQARFFLLSHMRGHIADMDAVTAICAENGLTLIEDCAHTLGAHWKGRLSGSFGEVSCFSTQTYKHMNSGEGGLLVTDRDDIMARAILYSGSYMLYDRHPAGPPPEAFEGLSLTTPNYSGRMDNLRAATLRPQLAQLGESCRRWNERYAVLAEGLAAIPSVRLPERSPAESFVGSSIQFQLPGSTPARMEDVVARSAARGVQLKWFGADEPRGYTSRFDSWRYLEEVPDLPGTRKALATLLDMRVPLTFDLEDCSLIVDILADVIAG
jgi:dTDP-4-amino-4,6-dideoxygalactose transaminase